MSDPPPSRDAADNPSDVASTPETGPPPPADAQSPAAPAQKAGRRRVSWRLVVGILLILAAVAHYLKTGYQLRPPVVIGHNPSPIEIPPDLPEVDSLSVEPGEFAGSNVLLVTFDTTRADRVGCYGNEAIKTPTLDRLAREGVIFSKATATAPTTVPAHASIITGLYPEHHGAYVNGSFRLTDEHQTLAETLADKGYATGAVISAFVLDSRFGLDQGFDRYDDDLSDCEEPPIFLYKESKADRTTQRAIEWLRGATEKPFFYWVHYFDPHALYEPPSPYAEQYAGNPYDGEIAFVDAQLGKLVDVLDELGITDRTLVVVMGDHGDSLGQHNELTHAFLTYEATLRVPFVMRCGQRLGGGVHVSRRVSQVDVVPTLHSLLGLEAPPRTDGIDLTQEIPEARPIIAETRHGLLAFGWGVQLAVYVGDDKYIYGPKPALYDLSQDRDELNNIIDSRPERAEELKQELVNLFGPDLDMTEVAQPTETLSMADRQKLEAMGYVVPEGGSLPPPAERADPEGMMPAMHVVEQIMYTPDVLEDVENRIERLEKVTRQYTDFHPAFRFLADLYRANHQPEEALKNYGRCLEVCRDVPTLYGMALANLALDKPDVAKQYLTEIVAKYPAHLNARICLGVRAGEAADYDVAIDHFRRVLDIEPGFVQPGMQPCALQLVQAYVAAGRGEELPGILAPKLEARPESAHVRAALARYYANNSDFAKAEQLLREGVAIAPGDHGAVSNLAMFLVGCPDPQFRKVYEGLAMMEDLCEKTGYREPELLSSLSLLYSMAFRIDEAIAMAERAKSLAAKEGNPGLVQGIERLLERLRTAKATGAPPTGPMPGTGQ